ncbi:hypothetical protein ABGF49_05670 [Helcococcus ovis]|uniref:Uncharacterized protein n=1 Tax=Helcococcus ovis TaxID=72026 RepID=A0A4R9C2A4_9FIRM|nr:hypothetical protein [Helcococcus ovis]TFF63914.1 hypothetical protein EQF92_07915 [Helcococcus ovis]TFF66131.1 hypothetical protein EQF93_07565 [Helcococcus ovis]TFF67020.1 hypothetical protein EQF91_02525 [Helcococcus ovis]WNZ01358.1 hypothetical protein EQF90_000465 [Helcococcus ovis]
MELVLPQNYVEIEQEEMEYLDGGIYVNDETVKQIGYALGVTGSTSIAAVAISVKLGAAAIVAKLSVIPGGNIIAAVGAAYIIANAGNIAPAFVSALVRGKGMDIGTSWWYALPVLSFSAR